MATIDLKTHPFSTVQRILDLINGPAWLTFSTYHYEPQKLSDKRIIVRIPREDLTEKWLLNKLATLRKGEELALHSLVRTGGGDVHIPMIDFSGIGPDHFHGLVSVFGLKVEERFDFFRSGRSFHAYGRFGLMETREWVQFMGRLLLCNFKNMPEVVDQRWVGHRLLGGYSALRWSCNSDRHQSYPTLIERIRDLSGLTRAEKLFILSNGEQSSSPPGK